MVYQKILLLGLSASGKTHSLTQIKDKEGILYLGCEGTTGPFKESDGATQVTITDCNKVITTIQKIIAGKVKKPYHTVIVDGLNNLMNQFHDQVIATAKDSRTEWGKYGVYLRSLLVQLASVVPAHIIFIGHYDEHLDAYGNTKYYLPVQGKMMNDGKVESLFDDALYCRRVKLEDLNKEFDAMKSAGVIPKDVKQELLNITAREKYFKYKHVFQTLPNTQMMHSLIRSVVVGTWEDHEMYIDNNMQYVLDRLNKVKA